MSGKRDNTRVHIQEEIKPTKLTPAQQEALYRQQTQKNQSHISDANKSKFYAALQDNYNQNIFYHGFTGRRTNFNPNTEEGQQAIQDTYDYAKGNAKDFIGEIVMPYSTGKISDAISDAYKTYRWGFLPKQKVARATNNLGTLEEFQPHVVASGAESMVAPLNKGQVVKASVISPKEMALKNEVPHSLPHQILGYIKDGKNTLRVYAQKKVKPLTEKTFPKYLKKLDKAMFKQDYKIV